MDVLQLIMDYEYGKVTLQHVANNLPYELQDILYNPNKYTYGYSIVIPKYLEDLLDGNSVRILTRLLRKDYICTYNEGNLLVLRYYSPTSTPQIGEATMVTNNWDGSFGEGLYVCDMTKKPDNYSDEPYMYTLQPDRVACIVGGYAKYLQCIYSNDLPKDNEILVLPETPLKVIYKCETEKELQFWVNYANDIKPAFIDVMNMLKQCVDIDLLKMEGDNMYVYRSGSNTSPEGWYLENIHNVTRELMTNPRDIDFIISQLEEVGIHYTPTWDKESWIW